MVYELIDGRITSQTDGTNTLYFRYESNNELFGINVNGTEYVYVKNLQGDVTGIADMSGNVVVQYRYDPWGQVESVTGSLANTLGQLNPMRYRGYYLDAETGYYYLQSRYYEPEMRRFINADDILLAKLTDRNLFAYCFNNTINMADSGGNLPQWIVTGVIHLAITGYFGIWGWLNYYAAKSAIAGAGNLYLSYKRFYVSKALFNHGMWGYGKSISQSTKNLIISALKKSSYFKGKIKKALDKVKGASVNKLKVSMNFTTGDLYYSIGKIDFYLTGTKKNGRWNVKVTGSDWYNFDQIRTFSKFSFGNMANDLGWAMQKIGMMTPYLWNVSFVYTY